MNNFRVRVSGALALAVALFSSTPSCFAQFDLLYAGGANGTFSNTADWDGAFAPAFQFTQDSLTFNSASGATVDNDLDPATNGGVPLQIGLGADPTAAAAGSRLDSGSFHFLDGSGDFTLTGFPIQVNSSSAAQVVIARVEPTAGTTQTINNDLTLDSFANGNPRIVMLNAGNGGKLVLNGDLDFGTSRIFFGDDALDSPATVEFNGNSTGTGRPGTTSASWSTGAPVNHGNQYFSAMRINPGDTDRDTIESANGTHIIAGSSTAFGDAHSGTWANGDLQIRSLGSIRVERFNNGYADNNTLSTSSAAVDLSEYGLQMTFGANWNFRSDFDTSVGWITQVWAREDLNATNDNYPNPLHPTMPGREIQPFGSVTVDGAGALTVAAHGGIIASYYDGAEQIDLRLPGTSGEVAGANGRLVVNGKLYNSFIDPASQTTNGTLASGGIQPGAKIPQGDANGQLFIKPGQMDAEDGSLTNGSLAVSYGTITLNGDSGSTWKGSQYRATNGSTTIIGHDNALGDSGSLVSIEDGSIVDTGTHTVAQKFINTDGTIRGNGTLTNPADLSVVGTVQPGGETPSATDTLTFDFSGSAAANTVQFESTSSAEFVLAAGTASSTIDVLGSTGMTSINFGNNEFAFTDLAGGSLSDGAYILFDGDANTNYALGGSESITGLGGYSTTMLSIVGNDLVLNLAGGSGGGLSCDAEPDGDCDINDIDALYAVFGAAGANGQFDFDADGDVDTTDISAWLTAASVPSNTALNSPTDQLVLGDINFDGAVDSSDLGLMLNNFGDSAGLGWGGGDLNGDMNVNSTDLGLLLNNFNFTSPAAASAVPEPASALLLLLAMGGLFAARGRSRVA